MKILAIDPGSKFMGWAILDFNKDKIDLIDCGLVKPSKEETIRGSGFHIVYQMVQNLYDNYKPEVCIVENFTARGRLKGATIVPKVHAIIECAWWVSNKTEVEFIQPRTWKYILTKNSQADKEETTKYLLEQGYVIDDTLRHDTYDAIGIGVAYCKSKLTNEPPTIGWKITRKPKVKKRTTKKPKKLRLSKVVTKKLKKR